MELHKQGRFLYGAYPIVLILGLVPKPKLGNIYLEVTLITHKKKIEELRIDNKNLFTQLASYHTWKPEDIQRLEQELQSSKDSYSATLKKQLKLEEENKKLTREKLENSDKSIYLEDQLKKSDNISSRLKASNRATYNLHNTLYNLSEKLKNKEKVANFIDDKGLENTLIAIISGHSKKIMKFGDHPPELGYSLGLLISENEINIQIDLNEDGETVAIINKSSNEIEEFLSSLPEETANKLAFHAY
jgi:exonuclease VII large subunit